MTLKRKFFPALCQNTALRLQDSKIPKKKKI